jgi:hypothetical protein
MKLDANLIIKSCVWSGLFWGAPPNLMTALLGAVTWCGVALPLFGSDRLDQTGSSCKAGLIAVF